MNLRAVAENPFYILGLPPDASRAAIEREGQKLLSMLGVNLASATTYLTPVGPQPRTAEKVRWALHELREPRQRARHELWARLPVGTVRGEAPPPACLNGALAALGWDF